MSLEDIKLDQNAIGIHYKFGPDNQKRVLLMRNEQNDILRIYADRYDSTDVKADIQKNREKTWKPITDWHAEHEKVKPFLDHYKEKTKDDELA